jgi:predicted permease
LALFTFFIMYGLTRWLKFEANLAAASTLSVMIFNSANYGIPLIQLALQGDEKVQGQGLAIQVITITAMNVITYTIGVLIMGGWSEWKNGVKTILKLPILYALFAALLIRGMDWNPPDFIMTPLKWVSDGMAPIALLTLGAQLGQGGISLKHPKELWMTVAARLLLCPLLAFLLIYVMGFHGLIARVLFISSAFPTAVATVLFGIEYNKEPTFAADVVFITTLLSAVTVTGAISLSAVLF